MRSVIEAECYRVEDAQAQTDAVVYLRGAAASRPPPNRARASYRGLPHREICGFLDDLEPVDLAEAEAKLRGVMCGPTATVCEGPVIYSYAASRAQAGYASITRRRLAVEHRTEFFARSVRIVAPREGFVSVHYVEDDEDASILFVITRWLSTLAFVAAEEARKAADLHTAHLFKGFQQPPDLGCGPAVWTA